MKDIWWVRAMSYQSTVVETGWSPNLITGSSRARVWKKAIGFLVWLGISRLDLPGLEVVAEGTALHREVQPMQWTSTIYLGPKENFVFNAATIFWCQGLSSPPGHMLPWSHWSRPHGPDKRVQKVTHNLIQRAISSIDQVKSDRRKTWHCCNNIFTNCTVQDRLIYDAKPILLQLIKKNMGWYRCQSLLQKESLGISDVEWLNLLRPKG